MTSKYPASSILPYGNPSQQDFTILLQRHDKNSCEILMNPAAEL
jgi:phage protein U